MSDDASVAIESPPAVEVPSKKKKRKKEQPADARPKQQPPYAVVLFNDEEHTFQFVIIETLMKVFGYPPEKSGRALRRQIHNDGKGHRVVGHPGGGRTQTGSDSFGWPWTSTRRRKWSSP